jgi:hypothetical protein
MAQRRKQTKRQKSKRKWYLKNKEKCRRLIKKWQQQNKQRVAAHSARYRARLRLENPEKLKATEQAAGHRQHKMMRSACHLVKALGMVWDNRKQRWRMK